MGLLAHHHALLQERAIAPEVAEARGYFSAEHRRDLEALGFQGRQAQLVPTLVIPIFDVRGEVAFHQLRPDNPRVKNGKRMKYETKTGARMVIDIPPGARQSLANPAVPLFVTEGVPKGDSAISQGLCCIALLGVWNWRGTNELGGTLALACWEQIPLNDRIVFIAFDSDVMVKPQVARALGRLGAFLKARGAQVHYIYLPPASDGSKQGLDDFFAAGHTVRELLECATTELRGARERSDASSYAWPYAVVDGRILFEKPTKEGFVDVPLCNFDARIVAEVVRDDGVERSVYFRIEGVLQTGERLPAIEVPAERFGGMQWVSEWGSRAVISAGAATRDHLRAAIQLLSGDAPRTVVFTHTGWREIEGEQAYLHAGGALGVDGPLEGVAVLLPDPLRRFELPMPPEGEARLEAVRASLRLLEIAPDRVMVPLLGAVYRSVIDPSDFTVHLVGLTGVFKSELAALAQQHFGSGLDARNLPASWSSTANSLEIVAFCAKATLLVVDDFAPTGTASDVARMHREAERLLRAQGNRSGRGRLRSDVTLRPVKAPRGLILSTGEDVPGSQSVRARLVVVEVRKNDVNVSRLTAAQRDAAAGLNAAAMSLFIRWLAPQRELARERLRESVDAWRQRNLAHRRYADSIGQLAAGFALFLSFASEIGAIAQLEKAAFEARAETALLELAEAQAAYARAADPVTRFLELMPAALVSGRAHFANATDEMAPPDGTPEGCGWRRDPADGRPRPQGRRVGWIRGQDVFLDPDAAFAEVQRLAQTQGTPLGIRPETLWSRMAERGLLVSHQKDRFTAQPRIGERRQRVLHFRADRFVLEAGAGGATGVEQSLEDAGSVPGTVFGTAEGCAGGAVDGAAECSSASRGSSDNAGTGGTGDRREGAPGDGGVASDLEGMEIF